MKLNLGQILGSIIIVISIGLIAYQATRQGSSVTFYTPKEVYDSPEKFQDKLFRISGLVERGTKVWNPDNQNLKFRITDLAGHDFNVHYVGTPPDLFKEGQGVIIEGKLQKNYSDLPWIQANLLLVKHSEVYDTKQDHAKMREAKLLDSILKENHQK